VKSQKPKKNAKKTDFLPKKHQVVDFQLLE